MLTYCDANGSVSQAWVNGGINQCFLDTWTSAAILVWVIIGTAVQLAVFWKYTIINDETAALLPLEQSPPLSCFGRLQVALHILTPLISVARQVHLIVVSWRSSNVVLGYAFFVIVAKLISWAAAAAVLRAEAERKPLRRRNGRSRSHGVVLLVFWTAALGCQNLAFLSWCSSDWWWSLSSTEDDVSFTLWAAEDLLLLCLFVVGLNAPLLTWQHTHVPVAVNSSVEEEPEDQNASPWRNFWHKVKVIAPMVWPKGSFSLQARVIVCAILLIGGRVCNLYVPLFYRHIVNSIGTSFCWSEILIWIALYFLQGSGSLAFLNTYRNYLWVPVQQFSTKTIELKMFTHLHRLSMRWHLNRKTGEVLKIMDRGTDSIDNLLSYVVFQVLPCVADIVIAVVYFTTTFNLYFGLIVFSTMVIYMALTVYITETRTRYKRMTNAADNERNSKAVDSLLNFETVKYYGAADFEIARYEKAVDAYQSAEWVTYAFLYMLNGLQSLTMNCGMLGGSMLCAYYIHSGDSIGGRVLTVGDFVLYVAYVNQLFSPLIAFGSNYRIIQAAFVDMENMLDLLNQEQDVKDVPNAPPLAVPRGHVEFKDVNFYYDPRKPILKGISFKVPPGQVFALVGPSGSGKTTIIRLLFRLYDLPKGHILIDGQDITQVQQESLRKAIGVVPQDTVLFNADIRYNIRYGREKASEEEVVAAAVAADMDHRIAAFPSGYDTVVGERGLKLSGGEKQRVAIARTIIKNPGIVLLDEATSALDTKTERNIQASLSKVCENRTTLVVAHRLSTIIHAHQILVMQDGEIVERGTHDQLLSAGSLYHSMWNQQLTKAPSSSQLAVDGETLMNGHT